MSFVESRVCLRLFNVLARMIRQGLFRGQAYVLWQCGHLRYGGGGPRIRGEDGSCRHDRQVPPLMLSRSAAAMDTFDFALRCDPMASRLTHPTGSRSGPSGITSRRDARGRVSLAQARTDHQLRRRQKISTRSAQLPHPISACQAANCHVGSTRKVVSDTGEE
jgi:hypothetical protein